MKPGGPLVRRARIAAVSRRRRRRDASYPAARRQVADRADGLCEFEDEDGLLCGNFMVAVHHIAGRLGQDPHRLDNLIGLCSHHHDWVHAHPTVSYAAGWMVRRNR